MVHMNVYENRAAWLEARRSYIGGSDAAALVGLSPYKTNKDLYLEKTGQIEPKDISNEPYVQYGIRAEEYLRELFKLDFPEYEVHYVEHNLWINDMYPFAHASLDGWLTDRRNGKKGVLEIKSTEFRKATDRLKWKDGVPDNYYCQALWYLGVTGFDFVILRAHIKCVYGDDESATIFEIRQYRIDRSDPGVEHDIQQLMAEGAKFAERIKAREKPNVLFSIADPVGMR